MRKICRFFQQFQVRAMGAGRPPEPLVGLRVSHATDGVAAALDVLSVKFDRLSLGDKEEGAIAEAAAVCEGAVPEEKEEAKEDVAEVKRVKEGSREGEVEVGVEEDEQKEKGSGKVEEEEEKEEVGEMREREVEEEEVEREEKVEKGEEVRDEQKGDDEEMEGGEKREIAEKEEIEETAREEVGKVELERVDQCEEKKEDMAKEELGEWGEKVEKMEEWSEVSCYPQRPNAPDCSFYMRTGNCGYKHNCKFNHPPERRGQKAALGTAVEENGGEKVTENTGQKEYEMNPGNTWKAKGGENVPEKEGKIQCKYYLTPSGCKYGSFCKYGHHQEGTGSGTVDLNFMGLPVRHGERECPFYMRTGSCKYSTNCRFHHPDPTEAGGSVQSYESSPYMPDMPLPHQNLQQSHGRSEYQLPRESRDRPSVGYGLPKYQQHGQMTELPQRPGQPDCSYYMRHGTCGYKSCKFNHPSDRDSGSPTFLLSPMGLPLRPGQTVCTHYTSHGVCKFGPACMYDHPVSLIPQTVPSVGINMRS